MTSSLNKAYDHDNKYIFIDRQSTFNHNNTNALGLEPRLDKYQQVIFMTPKSRLAFSTHILQLNNTNSVHKAVITLTVQYHRAMFYICPYPVLYL